MGTERLEILYETFNPNNQIPFRFDYNQIVKNGLGTKDFIAPTSFVFQSGKHFKMGDTMGGCFLFTDHGSRAYGQDAGRIFGYR